MPQIRKTKQQLSAELNAANRRIAELEQEVGASVMAVAEQDARNWPGLLQGIFNSLTGCIAVVSADGEIVAVNKAWSRFSDNNLAERTVSLATGDNVFTQLRQVSTPSTSNALEGVRKVLQGEIPHFEMELLWETRSRKHWFLFSVSPLEKEGDASCAVLDLIEITPRKELEDHLQHNAFHDQLTGLPNRALLLDRLNMTINKTRRNPRYKFAVLYLDIDRFNLVNETFGHITGDRLLMAVANRLHEQLRAVDTLSRFGGDEFVLLLEDLGSLQEARKAAERIVSALADPFTLKKQEIYITVSVGIVMGSGFYKRADQILRDADNALHRAKKIGSGAVEIFDAGMHALTQKRLQMEMDLRTGLKSDEFLLHYQPIVCLNTSRIMGFEALVRWNHPERGLIPPRDFIPLAEETGLIVPLGAWVLEESCRKMQAIEEQYGAIQSMSVSVNISGRQFVRPDFVKDVRSVLAMTGLNPSHLVLELTESVVMDDAEHTAKIIQLLKELGVKVVIDDFGTGYSSLSYLQRFPVDMLKVDRSFVFNMEAAAENLEIVRTIITMAHNLGLNVVAEGIEQDEQLSMLAKLKCERGQGYLFSRPLPEDEFDQLLAKSITRKDDATLPLSCSGTA